jgi:hypothetical protein
MMWVMVRYAVRGMTSSIVALELSVMAHWAASPAEASL